MAKKTSWPVIILGISAFVLVVGVGLVAVVGYVIYQQFAFQAKSATEVSADEEFGRIVAKFDGQKPYLIIKDGEPVISDAPASASGRAEGRQAEHAVLAAPHDEGAADSHLGERRPGRRRGEAQDHRR